MAELPAQLPKPKTSCRLGADTKQLHGKATRPWINTGLEPAGEPTQLQLKQQANQLIELRQGEAPSAGPPGAMGRCPQFQQWNSVGKGMGHGMAWDERDQLHLQTLSGEMTGGNQGHFLSAPRSEMRQNKPQIITACSAH